MERTATLLKLKGATSPVTGLAFEHEYEITGERTVRMKTTATNGRTTPVSWDLWPNTRVRTEGFPYVLTDPLQMLRMDGPRPDDGDVGAYPSEVRDGWLTLPPGRKPESGRKKLWAKAYVRPAAGLIAYFLGKQLLLIRAPIVPRAKLHGEQAFIEMYRGAGKGEDNVLELEMHGPYETLAPGASMSFEQTFELLDYEGPETPEGHIARLKALRRPAGRGSEERELLPRAGDVVEVLPEERQHRLRHRAQLLLHVVLVVDRVAAVVGRLGAVGGDHVGHPAAPLARHLAGRGHVGRCRGGVGLRGLAQGLAVDELVVEAPSPQVRDHLAQVLEDGRSAKSRA